MFVPIDQLKPILGDLLANGRRSDPPRPWLGLTLEEHRGRVFVTRVTPDGPAAKAGIAADDLILGVAGAPVEGLADFYRKLWGLGDAGVEVPLDLLQGAEPAHDDGAIGRPLPLSQARTRPTDEAPLGAISGRRQPRQGGAWR